MGAGAASLPSRKVAVRSGGAALSRRHEIAVHAAAHRASRFAPFKSGILEDPVEPLPLRHPLHRGRTRRDDGRDDGTTATGNRGGRTEILDAVIGARADEVLVDGESR